MIIFQRRHSATPRRAFITRLTISVVLAMLLILSTVLTAAAAQIAEVTSYTASDGRIFVPLRVTSEGLGFTVTWNGDTHRAYVDNGSNTEGFYTRNNAYVFLRDGHTFICIDLFSSKFGVNYNRTGAGEHTFSIIAEPDMEILMDIIRDISETERVFGTESIVFSREYIYNFMKNLGYEVYMQAFEVNSEEMNVFGTGYNIVVIKPACSLDATGDILVIGAHYDSVPGVPGANDNGSGVAAVLEIARLLTDIPTDTEIRFILFDAEEVGIWGSAFYLMSLEEDVLERIVGMINFDMFASASTPADDIWQIYTADGMPNFLTDMLPPKFEIHWEGGTDHLPFFSQAIFSISFSEIRDTFFHTPDDSIENFCPDRLFYITRIGSQMVMYFMCDSTPSFAWVYDNPIIDRETVYSIDADLRLLFGEKFVNIFAQNSVSVTSILSRSRIDLDNRMVFPISYVAMIDWFGMSLETHFIGGGNAGAINQIIVIADDHNAMYNTLNERFAPVDFDESQASGAWVDRYNVLYVLVRDGNGGVLTITNNATQKLVEVIDGIPQGLTEREQIAWNRISGFLEAFGYLDGVVSVIIIEDGIGGNTFSVSSRRDATGFMFENPDLFPHGEQVSSTTFEDLVIPTIAITFDPSDLIDENGALYSNEALRAVMKDIAINVTLSRLNAFELFVTMYYNADGEVIDMQVSIGDGSIRFDMESFMESELYKEIIKKLDALFSA